MRTSPAAAMPRSLDEFLIGRIRLFLAAAGGNLTKQNNALKAIKYTYKLPNQRLRKLCRRASVCIADGQTYADLAHRLRSAAYRVDKDVIKKHDYVKMCMVRSVA